MTKAKQSIPNVRLMMFHTDVLRTIYPEWDTLNKKEKLHLIKNSDGTPMKRIEKYNVTTDTYLEHLADLVNPETSSPDKEPDRFIFGDEDSSFDQGDTSLNNEIGVLSMTDIETDAANKRTVFSVFIDSTELNGETLREIGILTADGDLWNHAQISPEVDKTESKTLVAEVFLGFSN